MLDLVYDVYDWHTCKSLGEMTMEEISSLEYRFVKFDISKKVCQVTNCCNFKCH